MRTLLSSFTVLLFLASCDAEHIGQQDDPNISVPAIMARVQLSAANPYNPYDTAGLLHNSVLEAYLPLENETMAAGTVISTLDSIANSDFRFSALVTGNYTAPTVHRITVILSDPFKSTNSIIAASGLGTSGKASIAGFCADVIALYNDETSFSDAYDFIVGYEGDVIADTGFTTDEKRILLTTTSLARYGYWFGIQHKKRKPRDRDWDYLITTLTSGIEGTSSDTASAIMMSAASAALANQ